MDLTKMKTVKDFINYDFESCDVPEKYWGDYTHANFFKGYFIPIARKEFKAIAKKIGANVKFSPSHFEWYAFFERNGKYVYVSVSDVRYWKQYDSVLFRTATDDHDYTGGMNNYCSYDKLADSLDEMLGLLERRAS